ncbi:MAG: peptide/nickel transport system ATP-binding protein [Myxococcota bacterium]
MDEDSVTTPLLELDCIGKTFPVGGMLGGKKRLRALDDVSLTIKRGEVVALVGESGSGKSTIARVVARLHAPDMGRILLDGRSVLDDEPRRASLNYRRRVQMIFQDPFGSLNPVHTVAYHLERPLLRHKRCTKATLRPRILELLNTVGLSPAEEFADAYPHALSGGQRQRVAIARALAPEPDLVLADEPTSMLDVSIRMGVLNLLEKLRDERGIAYLLITHDLASARYLADRIIVLYAGQIVEDATAETLVHAPQHPYTQLLLSAVPSAHSSVEDDIGGEGSTPKLIDPPPGCSFASRCPSVMDVCMKVTPTLQSIAGGRRIRCHLFENETARGAVAGPS